MNDGFYNPYHFIPLDSDVGGEEGSADTFRKHGPSDQQRHDVYDGLSGRIVCRLTPETPFVIGAEQEKGQGPNGSTRVKPFEIDRRPAIPASSLKGLIGSLIEAASNSAMRILDATKPVSWRQPVGTGLSALGMIKGEPGAWRLQPLSAPTIRYNGSQLAPSIDKWAQLFEDEFPLKLYIGEYAVEEPCAFNIDDFANTIRGSEETKQSASRGSQNDKYFYANIKDLVSKQSLLRRNGFIPHYAVNPVTKSRNKRYVVGQKDNLGEDPPGLRSARDRRVLKDPGSFCRGIVRVLGGEGRDMAESKKHEVFIPYPEEAKNRPTIRICEKAIEDFQALADQRTFWQNPETIQAERQWLPYTPFLGGDANPQDRKHTSHRGKDYRTVKLREGQIVYFDIDKDNEGFYVSKLSFSAIWRDGVRDDDKKLISQRDFFDDELLPFNAKRETVSPAEWLLGFVEEDRQPSGDQPHNAYRGRLRFSDAMLAQPDHVTGEFYLPGPEAEGRVILRELSSPKPPSPAMYFKPENGQPIAKDKLKTGHEPQGRKVYLHKGKRLKAPHAHARHREWASRDPDEGAKRKLAVKLVDHDKATEAGGFWFQIDFDNLSEDELNLLCYALRPTEKFRHKIGLGKPLGLGTVHIEPMALLRIDRHRRYTAANELLSGRRYHVRWAAEGVTLPSRYAREQASLTDVNAAEGAMEEDEGCIACAERYAETIQNTARRRALELLGDPAALDENTPVHTPLAHGQTDPEHETYKWFAKKGSPPQALEPITASTPGVPKLRKR